MKVSKKENKKMRLLSTLLMMCMVFTLLPMKVFAAPTEIEEINIACTMPKAGEAWDSWGNIGNGLKVVSTIPAEAQSSVNIYAGRCGKDGKILSPGEKFISGEKYAIFFNVKVVAPPSSGGAAYKIGLGSTRVNVNGESCGVVNNTPFGDGFSLLSITITDSAAPEPSAPAPSADSKPVDANAGQKAAVKEAVATGAKELKLTYTEGNKIVDKEIFQNIAGKDITVTFNMGDAWWIVKGTDIPTDMDFKDLNLGVIVDSDGSKNLIPVQVINPLTGEVKTVQCELLHNGPFGFKMSLHVKLGQEFAGMTALLRYYNETTGVLEDVTTGIINADGIVLLPMEHASKYVISIGTAGMSKQNTPAQNTPVQAPVQSAPKSPKTGEKDISTYYLALIAVAGIGIVTAGKRRKALK